MMSPHQCRSTKEPNSNTEEAEKCQALVQSEKSCEYKLVPGGKCKKNDIYHSEAQCEQNSSRLKSEEHKRPEHVMNETVDELCILDFKLRHVASATGDFPQMRCLPLEESWRIC